MIPIICGPVEIALIDQDFRDVEIKDIKRKFELEATS